MARPEALENLKPASTVEASDVAARVSAEDLAELMRAFNAAAGELGQTHEALRAEVARLKGELHEANRRLERSRRLAALGEMAAGIAHEVRNPLAAIALHAEMLRDDLGEGEPGQTAGKILRAARELDGVVGDVLRFARELAPTVQWVEAAEPARRAVATCQMMAEGVGVGLEFAGDGSLEEVEVDAGLVAQALANLVRNAVEAIAEEGSGGPGVVRMRVDVGEADGERVVVYEVIDNGPGLPEGAVERMFNPFYTTRQTGCGLGLAMVQRIVDAHGGSVDAASGEGGGARFALTLPVRAVRAMVTEGAA
ncbi:MAG: ATP-binding protein [Phycisphaerales bacterium JB064]